MGILSLDSDGMPFLPLFLFINFSILSWNCQGCASVKFPCVFLEYNMEYKANIVCLIEPRVSGAKANSIIMKLGL